MVEVELKRFYLFFISQKSRKTGYTKKAGRTLITSFKDYFNEVVVVTLDAYDDWNLHKNLSEYAFSQIKRRDL